MPLTPVFQKQLNTFVFLRPLIVLNSLLWAQCWGWFSRTLRPSWQMPSRRPPLDSFDSLWSIADGTQNVLHSCQCTSFQQRTVSLRVPSFVAPHPPPPNSASLAPGARSHTSAPSALWSGPLLNPGPTLQAFERLQRWFSPPLVLYSRLFRKTCGSPSSTFFNRFF